MDSKLYLPLNSWLQKADWNYILGRFLWFNMFIEGACNLLWLSCEQIIKVLLIQKNAKKFSQCSNLKDVHLIIDKEGKKKGHSVAELVDSINIEYPELKIVKYKSVLEKLQEYFYRRYVVNSSLSISLNKTDKVDELYFLLRNKIEPEVGLGVIDEIFI